jgi:hypothetical protein
MYSADSSSALFLSVSTTHAEFGAAMVAKEKWILTTTVSCYVKQGAHAALGSSPATAGAGSFLVPANTPYLIFGTLGADLSLLATAGTGTATLARAWSS